MKNIKSKIAIVALMLCTVFSFGETITYKDTAKAEVAEYVALIKPLIEAATGSNKIGGLPENVVYGILSLIAVSVLMYFHRRKLAEQDAAHIAANKLQNEAHANVIKDIVNNKS